MLRLLVVLAVSVVSSAASAQVPEDAGVAPSDAPSAPACERDNFYLEPSLSGAWRAGGASEGGDTSSPLLRNGVGYLYRGCRADADPSVQLRVGPSLQLAADGFGDAAVGMEARADWQVVAGAHWRLGVHAALYGSLNDDHPLIYVGGVHATYEPITIELEALRIGSTTPHPGAPTDTGSTDIAVGLRFGSRSGKYVVLAEVGVTVVGGLLLAAALSHQNFS